MDQTMEEMKYIGFSGVFSQSFKTIFTWKKIFAQITVTLILPLALIFIAHMQISDRFFDIIEQNPYQLFAGAFDSYRSYYTTGATADDWRNYVLFKSISIAAVTVASVLSTASVVFTIASVYTGRDVTFRKSMKAVPKIWKRLTVTLLCMFLSLFAYSLIASVVIFVCNAVFELGNGNLFSLVYNVVYIYGFLRLSILWQLASVVSVLESSFGIKAMIKATDLMNGKMKTGLMIAYLLYLFLAFVVFVYMQFVVYNKSGLKSVWRAMIGIVCANMIVTIFLLVEVTESVFYVVCKSYHQETVDPVSLSTFLSAYLSDSRPVFRTGEDIQLGRPHNQPGSQV